MLVLSILCVAAVMGVLAYRFGLPEFKNIWLAMGTLVLSLLAASGSFSYMVDLEKAGAALGAYVLPMGMSAVFLYVMFSLMAHGGRTADKSGRNG